MKLLLAAAVAVALVVPPPSAAHDVAPSPETAWIGGMATAAKAWLVSFGKPGGAQLPFDAEARKDWHYVPRRRPGVALRDMTMPQRTAAIALLRAGLSARGAARAEAIMALESVLAELEGTSRRIRDPLNYAFAVFGSPGVPPWAWRVEGHHLSIHVTVAADGHAAVTPLFTGSNPADRVRLSTLRVSPTTRMVPTGFPSRPSRPISTAIFTTVCRVSSGTLVSNCWRSRTVNRPSDSPRPTWLSES